MHSTLLPLKWTHTKICFEDLSFTYNLTGLATPECSKTVITNETEVVICSRTGYEINIFRDMKTKPVHGDLITLICRYDITEEVNKIFDPNSLRQSHYTLPIFVTNKPIWLWTFCVQIITA